MARFLMVVSFLVACGGAPEHSERDAPDASDADSDAPMVIIDDERPVVEVTATTSTVTDQPRNGCTQGIGEYLIQYIPTRGTCGELPDESGDYSKTDPEFLTIPKTCRVNKYYTASDVCTVTSELICDLPNGCTETRYQDFDWNPFVKDLEWLGDGLLQYSLACPDKPVCVATYHATAFPRPVK